MPAASAGSTRRGRRARCRARSRSASCACCLVGGDAAPSAALLAQHPGLVVGSRAGRASRRDCPAGAASLYLVDPLGNLVLRYPDDPDIKGIARDLTRLLKASRIG